MAERSTSRKRGREKSSPGRDQVVDRQRLPGAGAPAVGCLSERRTEGKGTRLRKGMVVLKGFLSPQEQGELAAQVDRLGLQHGGFFPCHNEKTKRMRMMNLGLKTDGKRHTLQIPRAWTETALRVCRLAAETDPSIPALRPDICVVNHYTAASRLGWHQDLFSTRDPGLPVVSLSLGQSATFQYRVSWKKTAEIKAVRLESGDALVFGGRSRGIIHAVPGLDSPASATATSSTPPTPPAAAEGRASHASTGCSVGGEAGGGEAGIRHLTIPGGGRFNLNFREL